MEEATRKALGAELGASPPEFLDELDEAELADLMDVLAEPPGTSGRRRRGRRRRATICGMPSSR